MHIYISCNYQNLAREMHVWASPSMLKEKALLKFMIFGIRRSNWVHTLPLIKYSCKLKKISGSWSCNTALSSIIIHWRNRACLTVSHNAWFWKSQEYSDNDGIITSFWLSNSGNPSKKMHYGNVVNVPHYRKTYIINGDSRVSATPVCSIPC